MLGVAVTFVLAGCGTQIPSDPSGTLDNVRNGTLRVGVSLNEGFVETGSPGDDEPTGPEVEIIEAFATLDAEIRGPWDRKKPSSGSSNVGSWTVSRVGSATRRRGLRVLR